MFKCRDPSSRRTRMLNDEHLKNMYSIFVTFLVLRLKIKYSFNDEHPQNIPRILIRLTVLKLERFNSFNEEHLYSYIYSIKLYKFYTFNTKTFKK